MEFSDNEWASVTGTLLRGEGRRKPDLGPGGGSQLLHSLGTAGSPLLPGARLLATSEQQSPLEQSACTPSACLVCSRRVFLESTTDLPTRGSYHITRKDQGASSGFLLTLTIMRFKVISFFFF